MTFFSSFPEIEYKFGDEKTSDVFRDIAIYSTVIDQIKNEITFYEDYTIDENQRPDQLSYLIYDNPNYHWTFFLVNDKIRERGWPISNLEILNYAKKEYPNKVINTLSPLINFTSVFKVGDTIEGRSSGAIGKIIHKNYDLGKLTIQVTDRNFVAGENIQTDGTTELVLISSVVEEHLSVRHYENGGIIVDVESNGIPSPGVSDVPITILDDLHRQNNDLRQIRIIKPSVINQVVSSFKEAIKS